MATVTPEIAMRILETLVGKQGTMFIIQRPSSEAEAANVPDILSKITQADYDRIIKKHAPQLGGYQWDDLQSAGLLSQDNSSINFAALTDLARACPDYSARLAAARSASNSVPTR